jgi:hypothetical protein
MKLSAAIIFATIASASAFAPAANKASFAGLRMSETPSEPSTEETPAPTPASQQVETPKAPVITMSKALPFQERPPMLDGSMAGDAGFDPVGFAKSKEDLMNYREAEIKHARLAMLAAAGWPISELFDRQIANAFGLDPVLDASDRAPSVLNGGLGKISPVYWVAVLAAAAAIDVYGISKSKNSPNYFPGNLGFDPFGIYPKGKEGQMRMQTTEIKNGRLAMIAVTAFAFQELVQKVGVVDETPLFFKPIGGVLQEYANSGYIVPN